jgi:hypothetical protein
VTDVSEELNAAIIRSLTMEAAVSTQAPVSIYQTTRSNIPENSHLDAVNFYVINSEYIFKQMWKFVIS